jgi:hypothetical protein
VPLACKSRCCCPSPGTAVPRGRNAYGAMHSHDMALHKKHASGSRRLDQALIKPAEPLISISADESTVQMSHSCEHYPPTGGSWLTPRGSDSVPIRENHGIGNTTRPCEEMPDVCRNLKRGGPTPALLKRSRRGRPDLSHCIVTDNHSWYLVDRGREQVRRALFRRRGRPSTIIHAATNVPAPPGAPAYAVLVGRVIWEPWSVKHFLNRPPHLIGKDFPARYEEHWTGQVRPDPWGS